MKIVKLLILFLLMSCSSTKVITDFDTNTNFTKYTSFNFYEDNGDRLNDFDIKRIATAIKEVLVAKRFSKNENPDFLIYFDAVITENTTNNTIAIGLGSGGRNGGVGVSGGIPIGSKKLNEKIIIKFVNPITNNLFWEGALTSIIKEKRTPAERREYLENVVVKILELYPPEHK